MELVKLKEFDSYEMVTILCRMVYWYKGDEIRVQLVDYTGTVVEVLLSDWNMKELIYNRHEIADIADYELADDLEEENTIEVLVEERKECEVKMEIDIKAKSENNVKNVVHKTTKMIRFLNCTFCDVKTNKKIGLEKHENRNTRKIPYPCDKCEICSSVFGTDEYLRKHVKNVH